MTITASADLGGLGQNESTPVIVSARAVPPWRESLPWLLLVGALLFERKARRGNRWMVVALTVGFLLVWLGSRALAFVPSEAAVIIGPALQAWVFGFVLAWLLSARLAGRRPVAGAIVLTGLASGLMLYALIDVDNEAVVGPALVTLALLWLGSAAGLVAAGPVCRRWPSLWAFLATMISSGTVVITVALGILAVASGAPEQIGLALLIAAGLAAGEALISLPLAWMLFQVPSQRQRLNDLLLIR